MFLGCSRLGKAALVGNSQRKAGGLMSGTASKAGVFAQDAWVDPKIVSDVNTIEMLVRFLMEQLPHDPACKDASRVFFGNTEAEIPLFNPQAYLPLSWMEQAISFAEINQVQREKQRQERERRQQEVRSQFEARGMSEEDIEALVLVALSFIPPRDPGSGNYPECRTVLMALHSHFGEAEAERIAEA